MATLNMGFIARGNVLHRLMNRKKISKYNKSHKNIFPLSCIRYFPLQGHVEYSKKLE